MYSRLLLAVFLMVITSSGILAEEEITSEKIENPENISGQSLIPRKATEAKEVPELSIKTNILPWIAAVPNIGAEISFCRKWSVSMDIWYCPWKISDNYSLKTADILPEGRWWFKSNRKGHYIDLHLSAVWYNLRYQDYRYQDVDRPLFGGGIGYGYKLDINEKWGFEFNIGAGFFNTRYTRYYNIENGAAKDTRVTTYWGIDRAGISIFYRIGNL